MSTPAWILKILAMLILLVAEVSAGQLVAARAWTGRADVDAPRAVCQLLTGIAVAGILVPGLHALPDAAWEAAFAATTAWFAWCLWQERQRRRAVDAARGYDVPGLVQSAAALYVFASHTRPDAKGSGTSVPGMGGMPGMAGGSAGSLPAPHMPVLALIFALLLVAFTVYDLDRRAGAAPGAGARSVADAARLLLLSPAVAKGCRVATGLTTAFVLIIMR